ncbi:hypothetical protein [Mucilaginibacter endophyticus]|uniref:hypothetical protein n=1 Tax=Mucilaginibacter endophyticus TaxID=2675003 RepID=UPI000E0CF210|nr:hypothetical protein [Mucilaginibacter endophyticus]
MNLLKRLFGAKAPQLEDSYVVTITQETISVYHPQWLTLTGSIKWDDIHTILLINTDEGPWLPDVWLTLVGDDNRCMIPQGAKGFEDIYDIVSKYEGFNFENAAKSMSCTDNAEFMLWSKRELQKT